MPMILKNFNRLCTILRLPQFGKPKLSPVAKLELPRGSILHYPPSDITEVGPAQTIPAILHTEKMVAINHIVQLTEARKIGSPIIVPVSLERNVMQYHRINKRLRRMRDSETIKKDPRTLLVENYAMLATKYRYRQSLMSWYERWHNIYQTIVERMVYDAKHFDRQNYLMLNIPDIIPSVAALRRAETHRSNTALKNIRDDQTLLFLELWTWLGPNRSASMFDQFALDQLKSINIILVYRDKFVNMNLGEINMWRKDGNNGGLVRPEQMQIRLFKTAIEIATSVTPTIVDEVSETEIAVQDTAGDGVDDTPEDLSTAPEKVEPVITLVERVDAEPLDDVETIEADIEKFEQLDLNHEEAFEVVKKDEEVEAVDSVVDIEQALSPEEAILKACTPHINAGTLTTKEYQRVVENSTKYKSIPNPYGEGTLADMLHVKPHEIVVKPRVLIDDVTIIDKTMAKTTTIDMERKYNRDVLPKDICGAVVGMQKGGVAVLDYSVNEVVDAANHNFVHKVKVHPVGGEASTISFILPAINDRGNWRANDIDYTMRKQRVD